MPGPTTAPNGPTCCARCRGGSGPFTGSTPSQLPTGTPPTPASAPTGPTVTPSPRSAPCVSSAPGSTSSYDAPGAKQARRVLFPVKALRVPVLSSERRRPRLLQRFQPVHEEPSDFIGPLLLDPVTTPGQDVAAPQVRQGVRKAGDGPGPPYGRAVLLPADEQGR